MKEVSGREAMEALALGMALYNEDGTVADTFVRDRKFMIGEHPHAEVIRAFGDGEEVQFFDGDSWVTTDAPGFYRDHEYRVKPKMPEDGDTFQMCDGNVYTATTAAKLYEMFGLGQEGCKTLVAYRHDPANLYGVSWDRLAMRLGGKRKVVKIFKSAKE